jgi:hypothetical protein
MSCAPIALGRPASLSLIRQEWKYQSQVFMPFVGIFSMSSANTTAQQVPFSTYHFSLAVDG